MKINIKYVKDIALIEPEGKININSSKLIEAVGSLLDKGISKIIINIESIAFIDYNGLSVLAIAYKNALNNKCTLKLCGVASHIMELLRVVKLDDIFEIYNNPEDAINSFQNDEKLANGEILEQPLRRRFDRLDIDIPATFRPVKYSLRRQEGAIFSGRAANISGVGLFIRTINILPPGTKITMELRLKKDAKLKAITGTVMWLADKSLQPDLYPGIAVAFTDMSLSSQQEVLEFVERHTVKRRA